MTGAAEGKGRRVTIDLSPAAAEEVDRLRHLTGLTTADLFRNAFSLFRVYVQALERGHDLCIVDPRDENAIRTRLEFPVVIRTARPTESTESVSKGVKR